MRGGTKRKRVDGSASRGARRGKRRRPTSRHPEVAVRSRIPSRESDESLRGRYRGSMSVPILLPFLERSSRLTLLLSALKARHQVRQTTRQPRLIRPLLLLLLSLSLLSLLLGALLLTRTLGSGGGGRLRQRSVGRCGRSGGRLRLGLRGDGGGGRGGGAVRVLREGEGKQEG
jgi:hypothetical protein